MNKHEKSDISFPNNCVVFFFFYSIQTIIGIINHNECLSNTITHIVYSIEIVLLTYVYRY